MCLFSTLTSLDKNLSPAFDQSDKQSQNAMGFCSLSLNFSGRFLLHLKTSTTGYHTLQTQPIPLRYVECQPAWFLWAKKMDLEFRNISFKWASSAVWVSWSSQSCISQLTSWTASGRICKFQRGRKSTSFRVFSSIFPSLWVRGRKINDFMDYIISF